MTIAIVVIATPIIVTIITTTAVVVVATPVVVSSVVVSAAIIVTAIIVVAATPTVAIIIRPMGLTRLLYCMWRRGRSSIGTRWVIRLHLMSARSIYRRAQEQKTAGESTASSLHITHIDVHTQRARMYRYVR